MQHGFEQAAVVGLDSGELGFELIAQGHSFIDLGDDAVLQLRALVSSMPTFHACSVSCRSRRSGPPHQSTQPCQYSTLIGRVIEYAFCPSGTRCS